MPDDLTKKGKPDRDRVNHNQDWEIGYQKKKKKEQNDIEEKKE